MLRKDFLQKIGVGSASFIVGSAWPPIARQIVFDDRTRSFNTPNFHLKLDNNSQTAASLQPKGAGEFDFLPSDWLHKRKGDGYYHLGDITMRLRERNRGRWQKYSTAAKGRPVVPLETSPPVLAAADLNPTLPRQIPLAVKRYWLIRNGHLALRFQFENTSNQPVEIGGLGIPMVFNNILTDRSLKEAHHKCSFCDPYIGLDAGYVQVTRLNGQGPSLVVVPEYETPLEAYKPLKKDRTKRGTTFEGFYEWMVHTKAYVQNEWKDVNHWNLPSSATLKPHQKRTYGVKFLQADKIRTIEDTLLKNGRPVAVGVPGYIVPMDQESRLFVKHTSDRQSLDVEPSDALNVREGQTTENGWKEYRIKGQRWGRSRLLITYKDSQRQSINYKVLKPQQAILDDLGSFLATRQWFDDKNDPFSRNPAPISYDYVEEKQVTQEKRVWVAGLSDEAGNGSWVAIMMKQLIDPDKEEIEKLEAFVDGVLDGGIQYNEGNRKHGVRKSMFYYDPDKMPDKTYDAHIHFGGWESWDQKQARSVGRSYNYPPVAAAYWVLYRLARNYEGLVTNHSWKWYLVRAGQTAIAMEKYAPHYAKFGQMEGTVFVKILNDLEQEEWTDLARRYKQVMKKRAQYWKKMAFPFGSEMPWDSTGQEEVYAWCHHFGYDEKAKITLDAITGYMPKVPHWGYNGSARRYWDFLYAGKLQRIERQLHHYGSGLNAIPVLTAYRNQPDDIHLLRIGYGGLMGAISNITEDGFGPCAFHAYPETLSIDGYSGDYGPNFLGHVINTGTYIVKHPEFGWLTFGGNQQKRGGWMEVTPLDSSRSRIYLALHGLWLTLEAGKFKKVRFNTAGNAIQLTLDQSLAYVSNARLKIAQPGRQGAGINYQPPAKYSRERGAYVIPLGAEPTQVKLHHV